MMVEVENLKMSWLQVEQAGCKQSEGQQTSTLCTCNCSPASGTVLIVLFLWDGAWFRDMCNVFAAGWCWLIMSWRRNCTWSRQWRGAKRVAGEVDPRALSTVVFLWDGARVHGTCIIFGAGWRWLIMGWRANWGRAFQVQTDKIVSFELAARKDSRIDYPHLNPSGTGVPIAPGWMRL